MENKETKSFLNTLIKKALDYSYNPMFCEKRITEFKCTEELYNKIIEYLQAETNKNSWLKNHIILNVEGVKTYNINFINGIQFKLDIFENINILYLSNYEHWKEDIQIKPIWKFHIENIEDIPILIIINKMKL